MTKNKFGFNKTVYLGDTNAEGNVYFARYFEWQGEAREEFYRRHFPVHLLLSGLKLITAHAEVTYKKETVLFDEIVIGIKIAHAKKMSLELLFMYTNAKTNEQVARGLQKIAFADAQGNLVPIPEEIRISTLDFLADENDYREFGLK